MLMLLSSLILATAPALSDSDLFGGWPGTNPFSLNSEPAFKIMRLWSVAFPRGKVWLRTVFSDKW